MEMNTLNLDYSSVNLMLQLQIQDLEEIIASSKGKYREGETPDADLALVASKSELEFFKSSISDRWMCKSITQAVISDGELVCRQQGEENLETRDREFALNLDTNRETPSDGTADSEPRDEGLLGKLEALHVHFPDDDLDRSI
ncbi:hypothetical protein B0J13DRAFT_649772 [Dactylonectria estremocensis]|uniref:Uncharacterized protein n=1 Tax=Dactylonectria estremocensis TaxID=1079267 RepID=A0A9P9JE94_9HYPO|nr:hypothetical protein B0J13DRAFT_649772 [Dactylonectria estremocensis]